MAICALALAAAARADELNVAEGETVTLSSDYEVTGGTIAGTLILTDGMTLTMSANTFASTATNILQGATVKGFGSITELTWSHTVVVAEGTSNAIENTNDSYSGAGCNFYWNGTLTGAGELTVTSTCRGVVIGPDASAFTGTLNVNQSSPSDIADSSNWFIGRFNSSYWNNATINITGGTLYHNLVNFYVKSLNIAAGVVFTDTRGFDDSNILNLYGPSRIGGTLAGNQLDINLYSGAELTMDAAVARVNIDSGALRGAGTISALTTWGNNFSIANDQDSVLTISAHSWSGSPTITVTGDAGNLSGNTIFRVPDTVTLPTVALSAALTADHYKLRATTADGYTAYAIYKPGLLIIVR